MKKVILPNKTISYKVDIHNRRVAKYEDNVLVQYYVWNSSNQLVGLADGSGVLNTRFVYGSKSHSPDYMIKDNVQYQIVSNHLGTPASVVSSSTGDVVQKIVYDEFGNIISDSQPGFMPIGYAGCLYEDDTKLCRFGARDYNSSIGRWLTKDPIMFAGGDANLYGYVMQDPINLIDPSGLRLEYGSQDAQRQLSGSLSQIWGTAAGNQLLTTLMESPNTYILDINSSGRNTGNPDTAYVTVDPSSRPYISGGGLGMFPATTTRILAHELGHLTGMKDIGNLNVNAWENNIMEQLGGQRRSSYYSSGVRCGN